MSHESGGCGLGVGEKHEGIKDSLLRMEAGEDEDVERFA